MSVDGVKGIAESRREIDEIDDDIVQLVVRRLDLMADVAAAKRATGTPVRDDTREHEILEHVSAVAGEAYAHDVRMLFTTLFGISRERQYRILKEAGR